VQEIFKGDAVIVFPSVGLAVKGRKILSTLGFKAKLVAPPARLGMGCDLCVEFLLADKAGIENALKEAGIAVSRVIPLDRH
jgi:hypothetical protein